MIRATTINSTFRVSDTVSLCCSYLSVYQLGFSVSIGVDIFLFGWGNLSNGGVQRVNIDTGKVKNEGVEFERLSFTLDF